MSGESPVNRWFSGSGLRFLIAVGIFVICLVLFATGRGNVEVGLLLATSVALALG